MEYSLTGIPLLLGISLMGGAAGAWLFQRLKIPQVVGYIVIGVLLGNSGLQVIQSADIVQLGPLNLFALGLIGFLVGGELKITVFRKYAKQFLAILLGEGLTAFFIVTAGTFVILNLHLGSTSYAAAGAVIFGAIASATDPASTIDVLWEYRAQGILTTSITAIVALDDALAMSLYGLGTCAAKLLTTGESSLSHELTAISIEILGAALCGFVFSQILRAVFVFSKNREKSLAISLGLILLLIGISVWAGMDIILAAMMMGFSLTNTEPKRSKDIFKLLRGFSEPIYVLFFVLVGARIAFSGLPGWLWLTAGVYITGRSFGKIAGAWFGATIAKADIKVRKYLGAGILAQGGVAVGLSIMAGENLNGIKLTEDLSLGTAVIYTITATTLFAQLIGPAITRLVIHKSGEENRNITDEDILNRHTAGDFMLSEVKILQESMTATDAIREFSNTENEIIPVANNNGKYLGIVSIKGIKSILFNQNTWQWLLVSDLVETYDTIIKRDTPLQNAFEYMKQVNITQVAVIDNESDLNPIGILDLNHVKRKISDEIIKLKSEI